MDMTATKLNILGAHWALPAISDGKTRKGPVAGGHAEVHYAGLHKSWTATRIVGAVATLGFSLLAGRKEEGSATLVVVYGNNAVSQRRLKTRDLSAAQRYAISFTAYAWKLWMESGHFSWEQTKAHRGYESLAASQDDEDRAYHEAMGRRPRGQSSG